MLLQTKMRFQFLITFFIWFTLSSLQVYAAPGRLTVLNKHKQFSHGESKAAASPDFRTYLYSQTLDHFNYNPQSYNTFNQRFVMNTKYWGGANSSASIFAYLGEEISLDQDVQSIGFLRDNAPAFKALIVYIEVT